MSTSSPEENPDLRRLVTLLVAGVGIVLLLAFSLPGRSATRVYQWPWAMYAQILGLIPLVLLALLAWGGRLQLDRWVGAALGGLALSLTFSTAAAAAPRFSFEALLPLVSGLAWAGVVAALRPTLTTAGERRLAQAAGVWMTAVMVSGLAQWLPGALAAAGAAGSLGSALDVLLVRARNPHPFGHWNYTGGFALLGLAWTAGLAADAHQRGGRSARNGWAVAAGIGALSLLSSGSRGALLGAAAGTVVALGWMGWSQRWRVRTWATLGAVALLGLALAATLNPRIRALVVPPDRPTDWSEGDLQRQAMLEGGARLFLLSPWLGHGAGMTPLIYPEVRRFLPGGVETSFQLHNAPLQVAVDGGVVGLAAAALALGVLGWSVRRRWRASGRTLPPLDTAAAGGCIAYGVFAVTDYQLHVIGILAALGALAGWLLARPPSPTPSPPAPLPAQPAWVAAYLVVAAGALALLVEPWRARSAFAEAWSVEGTNPSRTLSLLASAADAAPWQPAYGLALADWLALQADRTRDPARTRDDARALYGDVLVRHPNLEPAWVNLGWLRWRESDARGATSAWRRARHLLPGAGSTGLGLGLAALSAQDRATAVTWLAREVLARPAFALSPLWREQPLAAVAALLPEEIERLVAARPGPGRAYAAAFARWWWGHQPIPAEAWADAPPGARELWSRLQDPAAGAPPPAYAWLADGAPAEAAAAAGVDPAAALAAQLRLAGRDRPPADWSERLRLPPASDPADRPQSRIISKLHWALMFRNVDGPGLTLIVPQLEDPFAATWIAPLLPRPLVWADAEVTETASPTNQPESAATP